MNTRFYILTALLFFQLSLIAQGDIGLIDDHLVLKVPYRKANNPATEGTPLLLDDFVKGTIVFSDGNKTNIPMLNYDASAGSLVFKYNDEMWLLNSSVKEFILRPIAEEKPRHRLFRNGYPGIDNKNKDSYYEILVDGDLQLLSYLKKEIKLVTTYGAANYKEYVVVEQYYFFDGNSIKALPPGKGEILELLSPEQRIKAESILGKQKNNLRKIESIKELLEKLNGGAQ